VPKFVRDDPESPDPGFAELYGSLPDATDLEPWLAWCRQARPPVLYLGIGAGRLAVPLARAGVELVGVDVHPGMLQHLRGRDRDIELIRSRIEDLDLGRAFDLVVGPSSILSSDECLAAAARHSSRLLAIELMNPHWVLAGPHPSLRLDGDRLEVDYPGGYTQQAEYLPRWPEDADGRLEALGLDLVRLFGHGDLGLEESPTYYALASKRLRSAQMPST